MLHIIQWADQEDMILDGVANFLAVIVVSIGTRRPWSSEENLRRSEQWTSPRASRVLQQVCLLTVWWWKKSVLISNHNDVMINIKSINYIFFPKGLKFWQ